MNIEKLALIAKALSDTNRLNIIKMLTKGKMCACELLEKLQITQPTLSHHMKILCESGLVLAFKEGKWQHYCINCERFKEFKESINAISCLECEK